MKKARSLKACSLLGASALILLTGCTAALQGTRVLYDTEHGSRHPASEVARILMNDRLGFGKRLQVIFDEYRDTRPEDTLEFVPGKHTVSIVVEPVQLGSYVHRHLEVYGSGQPCVKFDFVAQAGHEYEFKVVKFEGGDWAVDLVDRMAPSDAIHGEKCNAAYYWRRY